MLQPINAPTVSCPIKIKYTPYTIKPVVATCCNHWLALAVNADAMRLDMALLAVAAQTRSHLLKKPDCAPSADLEITIPENVK